MTIPILHYCQICNAPTNSTKTRIRKFCSPKCYHQAQREGVVRVGRDIIHSYPCCECGDTANRHPSRKRNGDLSDKVFCSRSCYDTYREKKRGPCATCGKQVALKSHKYCSWECTLLGRKPDPSECVNCRAVFTALKPLTRKGGRVDLVAYSDAKTCSPECLNLWIRNNPERKRKISLAFTREKHPGWQGGSHREGFRGHDWAELSEKIRDRAGRCCEHCGMTESDHVARYNQRLNVNHIEPFHQHQNKRKANSPKNLEALCKSCHTKADWRWRKNNPLQTALTLR